MRPNNNPDQKRATLHYNVTSNNIVDAVLEFAKQHPAFIILLMSKRHHFPEGVFYRSVIRQLAYISPFPLLALREQK